MTETKPEERAMTTTERMSVGLALANIAQGVINIDEGLTVIEPDSRVHRGMSDLIEHLGDPEGRNEIRRFLDTYEVTTEDLEAAAELYDEKVTI